MKNTIELLKAELENLKLGKGLYHDNVCMRTIDEIESVLFLANEINKITSKQNTNYEIVAKEY